MNVITDALRNPKAALHALERLRCERSLYEFVKAAWPIKHPATPFTDGEAIQTVCRHLEAVSRGDIQKLLINIPPGCTKSMIVNVFWPLWLWGPKGQSYRQIISAGYNLDLPVRDLGYARDIQRSEWYQSHWPIINKKDADGKENYTNTDTGWRKAVGVGGGLTGWRGHIFIIDDPHSTKTAESDLERQTAREWFGEAVPTRFNDPQNAVIVMIMQRLNVSDLSGMVIDDLQDQGWVMLCLPMEFEEKFKSYTTVPYPGRDPEWVRRIKKEGEPLPYFEPDPEGELLYCQDHRTEEGELLWPERFDTKSVEDLKTSFRATGGEFAIACQLQQRPVPRAGGMFDVTKLNFVDTAPTHGDECRGWDFAASKDGRAAWTVGGKIMISKGRIYIIHIARGRWSPGEVEDHVRTHAYGDNCLQSFPQDPGQSGKSQKKYLSSQLHGVDFEWSTESGSKEDRARPLAAQVEAGNVYIVQGPWVTILLAEMGLFPGSKYKDQVDALSRAYAALVVGSGPTEVMAPRLIS